MSPISHGETTPKDLHNHKDTTCISSSTGTATHSFYVTTMETQQAESAKERASEANGNVNNVEGNDMADCDDDRDGDGDGDGDSYKPSPTRVSQLHMNTTASEKDEDKSCHDLDSFHDPLSTVSVSVTPSSAKTSLTSSSAYNPMNNIHDLPLPLPPNNNNDLLVPEKHPHDACSQDSHYFDTHARSPGTCAQDRATKKMHHPKLSSTTAASATTLKKQRICIHLVQHTTTFLDTFAAEVDYRLTVVSSKLDNLETKIHLLKNNNNSEVKRKVHTAGI